MIHTRFLPMLLSLGLFAGATEAVASNPAVLVSHAAGTLTIEADGSVGEFKLDTRLGDAIDRSIGAAIKDWRFEPIVENGQPVRALGHMQLRLQAVEGDNDEFTVTMSRVDFTDPPEMQRESLRSSPVQPPRYPVEPLKRRLGAEVELLLEVQPDGSISRAAALDGLLLGSPGSVRIADQAMQRFNDAAIKAALAWNLEPSTDGSVRYWRAPVSFRPVDGTVWRRAIRKAAPAVAWLPDGDAGAVATIGADLRPSERIRLLTPLVDPAG